jgi:hypothetical protein
MMGVFDRQENSPITIVPSSFGPNYNPKYTIGPNAAPTTISSFQ